MCILNVYLPYMSAGATNSQNAYRDTLTPSEYMYVITSFFMLPLSPKCTVQIKSTEILF